MDRTFLFMFGAALILGGTFGIIETAIRAYRARDPRDAPTDGYPANARRNRLRVRREAPEDSASVDLHDESPRLAPTDEDLELVVIRERESNPDGTPRQDIIRDLEVGDAVSLSPEMQDEDGRSEIRIDTGAGTIGYVPPTKVPKILDMMTEGAEVHSVVSHIGQADGWRGVWINVSVWR